MIPSLEQTFKYGSVVGVSGVEVTRDLVHVWTIDTGSPNRLVQDWPSMAGER
jgi:hypothetical protein